MKSNDGTLPTSPHKGSIVLVASTSGYFGGSGVAGYVSSKHGVVGLLRSSQAAANRNGVRINGIAPFFTPSHITASYAAEWAAAGLSSNTAEGVARRVVETLADSTQQGSCFLVAGGKSTELETRRTELLDEWIGSDNRKLMADANVLFAKLGGYPLPKARSLL
ncbi:uncharacterized protein AB675_9051 [Cyphellophora attinorum]|uniref:Uncharacterized protein n=1 Tax=Cyphellophora attinorum TaxID=1664694 RepID=A0A0N1HW21_9EURO|nr:uncharacterized protein AB675_9051 [Phialophora attinorum]KPI41660.1 hypothetical protein AB675_9051 [Phialophora attinorum]